MPGDDSTFASAINDEEVIAGSSAIAQPWSSHVVTWSRVTDPADMLAELAEEQGGAR